MNSSLLNLQIARRMKATEAAATATIGVAEGNEFP